MRQEQISSAIVTGGAGFVGSHIVDELLRKGVEVYVIDNMSTGSTGNLEHHLNNLKLHLIVGDIAEIGTLMPRDERVDVIFHEAAIASVVGSVNFPMKTHEANVNNSLKVLDYCLKKNVRKIVFASSAAVYGFESDATASEEMICHPQSPYGASKLSVENYLAAYHRTYGLDTVALRYFNIYGPRQKLSSDYSGVITTFILRLLENTPPTIYGDGRQTRDFVHVRDVAQANMLAMESSEVKCNVFNVATGRTINIEGLLRIVKDVTCVQDVEHRYGPARPGDGRFGAASIDKISRILQYKPNVNLETGLRELTEFIRELRKGTVPAAIPVGNLQPA